jgi:DNA-binding NtrC family response regulator
MMSAPRDPGRRLALLWKRAREAVFVLNTSRRLVYANPAWEQMTGLTAAEWSDLMCEPRGQEQLGGAAGVASSLAPPPEAMAGRAASLRTMIMRPGGERVWKRVEYFPFHDESGALIGVFGIVRPMEESEIATSSPSQRLRMELSLIRESLRQRRGLEQLIGQGSAMDRLRAQIESAAESSTIPVLIQGERGTGKRLIARVIHARSARSEQPLQVYDLQAMPIPKLERMLARPGEGGSGWPGLGCEGAVLLVGLESMPRDLQALLAERIDQPGPRLLLTSIWDPEQALKEERVREDLYYGITRFVIRVAPLRERRQDIALLAQHFLERANQRGARTRQGWSEEAIAALQAYDWPGNVGELERVVTAAQGQGNSEVIEAADLPMGIRGAWGGAYPARPAPAPALPLDELLTRLERRLIEDALRQARQNKSRAADLLRISRPRLYRRIQELGIPDLPESVDATALTSGRSAGDPA